MSEREELAVVIGSVSPTGHVYSKGNDACPAAADAVLASPWLRAHDDRIRAEALAPVLALADEWERLWLAARAIKDSPITRIVNLNKAAAALRAAAGTPTHDATEEER